MESVSISEIVKWCKGEIIKGDLNSKVNSVSVDSRTCHGGSLFIPLEGEKVDGHKFIKEAFSTGARAALLSQKEYENIKTEKILIRVEDTLLALQDIAKNYRRKFHIPIIGVTGSVGKTTTKEMIASALSTELEVLKNDGNLNGQVGLPLTILNLEKHHQVAVLEMGISQFGEMDKLSSIALADIGVITNIGISHMENLKTKENIREEKLKLLKNYKGKYFLNGDSTLLFDIDKDKFKDVVYFGLNGQFQYRAEDILSDGESTTFTLVTTNFRESVTIPCLGIHNVYNALAAISVSLSMGMYLDDIKSGILSYKGVAGREEIVCINGVNIIDSSYNASPDSVKSLISVLRTILSNGRNIIVLADMLELGQQAEKIHYDLGKYIAVEGIDILITIGDLANFVNKGALSASAPIQALHFNSNKEVSDCICKLIKEGDKILVKGSRGMHVDEVVLDIKNYLSDLKNRKPPRNGG